MLQVSGLKTYMNGVHFAYAYFSRAILYYRDDDEMVIYSDILRITGHACSQAVTWWIHTDFRLKIHKMIFITSLVQEKV